MLNGDGKGLINNIAIPSQVSASYAPTGKSLIAVVLLGEPDMAAGELIVKVKAELVAWFGREVEQWDHLMTYRISHALPDQSPPTQNPYRPPSPAGPGIFICGEHGSLPGIQWALLSGRYTAQAVRQYLGSGGGQKLDH